MDDEKRFSATLNGPPVGVPQVVVFLVDGVWVAKARDLSPEVSERIVKLCDELNGITGR